MTRKIYCDTCGCDWKMHPEDVKEKWKGCVVRLVAKKPEDHSVTVSVLDSGEQQTSQLASIYCDLCGEPIPDGMICHAVTMWKDDDVCNWEHLFGVVLTDDAYKLLQRLQA